MKFYYTYVLISRFDNNLYVGWTNNLKNRIQKHQNGQVNATKYRRPLQLIYFEGCYSKDLAIKREKQLKTGFGRAYLNRRLQIK